MLAPKGALPHRTTGRAWTPLMIGVAGSSLFIHSIRTWGLRSPIYLLSLFAPAIVPVGVWRAHAHDATAHRRTMIWTFVLALGVAAVLTLAPGRIMNKALFGG